MAGYHFGGYLSAAGIVDSSDFLLPQAESHPRRAVVGLVDIAAGALEHRLDQDLLDAVVLHEQDFGTRLGQAAINMRGIKPMTSEQEARRERMRPSDDGPFSDWVIYAMGLEQMGLTSEAKSVWRKLSAQRPDDPKLRQLSQ